MADPTILRKDIEGRKTEREEYEKLTGLGVEFTMQPTKVTGSTITVFNDSCGNLIQINQMD
jgi:hypothetical protein